MTVAAHVAGASEAHAHRHRIRRRHRECIAPAGKAGRADDPATHEQHAELVGLATYLHDAADSGQIGGEDGPAAPPPHRPIGIESKALPLPHRE